MCLNGRQVDRKLEEFKSDRLARRLRADEDREIAEADVGVGDLADVLQLEMHGAYLRLRGSWAFGRRRVEG